LGLARRLRNRNSALGATRLAESGSFACRSQKTALASARGLDACEPGEGITVSAVAFTQADFDNLEIVRQIVFRRLKEDTNWNQLAMGGREWNAKSEIA
jgi:hypothetical protein